MFSIYERRVRTRRSIRRYMFTQLVNIYVRSRVNIPRWVKTAYKPRSYWLSAFGGRKRPLYLLGFSLKRLGGAACGAPLAALQAAINAAAGLGPVFACAVDVA
jgi:hypothetical protein